MKRIISTAAIILLLGKAAFSQTSGTPAPMTGTPGLQPTTPPSSYPTNPTNNNGIYNNPTTTPPSQGATITPGTYTPPTIKQNNNGIGSGTDSTGK